MADPRMSGPLHCRLGHRSARRADAWLPPQSHGARMTSSCTRGARGFASPNKLSIRGLLAVLLVVACAQARALDPSRQVTQYVLDNWQIPEGLPQTSVQALARTPDGYLWVGTQEGLARFDGVRFTVFDSDNEPAIPNRSISVLFTDRTGRLWVGTRSGIAVLENGRFTHFNRVPGLAHASVLEPSPKARTGVSGWERKRACSR